MLASSSRATVSSRRSRCVLATSGGHGGGDGSGRVGGPKEAAGRDGLAVTVSELPTAIDDLTVDGGGHDRGVVAVDHATQAAVELDGAFVVAVDGVVEAGRVDDHEVGGVALAQPAGVQTEPVGDLGGQAVDGVLDRHEGPARPFG